MLVFGYNFGSGFLIQFLGANICPTLSIRIPWQPAVAYTRGGYHSRVEVEKKKPIYRTDYGNSTGLASAVTAAAAAFGKYLSPLFYRLAESSNKKKWEPINSYAAGLKGCK